MYMGPRTRAYPRTDLPTNLPNPINPPLKNSKSATAEMINQYIKEGKIVPAKVTVGLLR